MINELNGLITSLKKNKNLHKFDEAATKQAIVLRFLNILGWDTFNVSEVFPEYPVGSYNIDYALRIEDSNKIFIEVKRINEELKNHQDQLLKYSFQEGVKISVLTNGVSWWFYLPLEEGRWERRIFSSIDVLKHEVENTGPLLIDILSKENVESGLSVKNAEEILKVKRETEIINNNLPKAWNKIIKDKNEFLVESICDATEELCDYRPKYSDVEDFLDSYRKEITLGISYTNASQPKMIKQSLAKDDFKLKDRTNNMQNSNSIENIRIKSEYDLESLLEMSNSIIKGHYIELRNWLLSIGNDVEEIIKKSMGCYYSKSSGKKRGLVWMEPRSNNLLFHLRKGKYTDSLNKIKQDGWGGYPEVKIFSEEFDERGIQYIKDLIVQAYNK